MDGVISMKLGSLSNPQYELGPRAQVRFLPCISLGHIIFLRKADLFPVFMYSARAHG